VCRPTVNFRTKLEMDHKPKTDSDCDVISVFCNVLLSKPAVFMVLHHTFDPEKFVPDNSRFVSRVNTLTVDCLFDADEGLLNCVKNGEALTRIHQWLQPQVSSPSLSTYSYRSPLGAPNWPSMQQSQPFEDTVNTARNNYVCPSCIFMTFKYPTERFE
uniref:Uncharacterized protein n=1 Tax=Sinocyclocheilus grahami TaxID=75366 RepID=A0A672R1P0_SINGR